MSDHIAVQQGVLPKAIFAVKAVTQTRDGKRNTTVLTFDKKDDAFKCYAKTKKYQEKEMHWNNGAVVTKAPLLIAADLDWHVVNEDTLSAADRKKLGAE